VWIKRSSISAGCLRAHHVLDVVVDDEIELFVGEAIVFCKKRITL